MSEKKAPKTEEKAPEKTVTAPENAPQSKAVKVKFLRTHPHFAVSIGEETEISQDDFDKYLQDGPFFERVHTR